MFRRWRLATCVVAFIAIMFGATSSAYAVAALGSVKRVDVDPTGTPIYQFGLFYVTRSPTGGFVVAWEQNNKPSSTVVYEGLRFRVYNNTFAPVAGQKSADISGNRRAPTLSGVVPLGSDSAYLTYALTRDNANPDQPEIREAFGQRIAVGAGAPIGARQLLNGNLDTLIGIPSGLTDKRAVFAWYEADEVAPAPGRFISSAGVPQAVSLNFACCGTIKEAQLVRLQPLGPNFLADYVRNSIFGNSGLYARVFKPNGQPLAAAKYFAFDPIYSPIPKALSNGRIVVFRDFVVDDPGGDYHRIVAQLYDKDWVKIGGQKILVPNRTNNAYVDFTPTLDGGLFMIQTLKNGATFTRSVRRYDANLSPAGPAYTFASAQSDFFRIAALSSNRAVVLFRNIVGGRHQLSAQIVSY